MRNQAEAGDHNWEWIVMVLAQWGMTIRLNRVY